MPRVTPGCNHKLDDQENHLSRADTAATVEVMDVFFVVSGGRLVIALFRERRAVAARTVNLCLIRIDINISVIAKSWRYLSGVSLNPG
jgi:hypothetical protein